MPPLWFALASRRSMRFATPDVQAIPVAIQGIGGLGHLGVQYAKKMGFRTVAIGFGPDKEHLAPKLGAHVYIDAKAEDAGAALQKNWEAPT